jgi:hypothetical protein
MKWCRRALPALVLCAATGCSRPSKPEPQAVVLPSKVAAQAPLVIFPELGLGAGESIEVALAEPLGDTFEVTLDASHQSARKTLQSCRDYLSVARFIYSAGPAVDSNVLYFEGARCDALNLLRSARPALHPVFQNFSFKHLAVKNLPPGMALIIANEEQRDADWITRKGGSILNLDSSVRLHATGPDKAELVTQDWTADLTVLARADFFGNGSEQLLLRRDAAATGGTYRSTRIFLLSRRSPSGPLRIEMTRP